MCPKSYTQPLYHSAYIDLFEIISAIIKMHEPLHRKALPSPSRMLANKQRIALVILLFHCRNYIAVGE